MLVAQVDLGEFAPGTFDLEWPPNSGRIRAVPEMDDVRWAAPAEAERLLTKGQRPFVRRLLELLEGDDSSA